MTRFARLLASLARLPLVGSTLRRLARGFPEGSVTAIRSGPAAGLRWRRWRRFVNGYWAGTYELGVQLALVAHLRPGATFYDVGASAGFFTVLGARLVGPDGHVVACEPLPANAAVVREQVAQNGFGDRVAVEEVALSRAEGEARFLVPTHGSGRVLLDVMEVMDVMEVTPTSITVRLATLDALADRYGPPDVVKMDVEGAEADVLAGAGRVLATRRPVLLIELHGDEQPALVKQVLDRHGYSVCDLDGHPVTSPDLPPRILARPAAPRA